MLIFKMLRGLKILNIFQTDDCSLSFAGGTFRTRLVDYENRSSFDLDQDWLDCASRVCPL